MTHDPSPVREAMEDYPGRVVAGITSAALVAAAAGALGLLGAVANAADILGVTPMAVVAINTSHVGGVERRSVVCIPANTRPFRLQNATYWREIEVPLDSDLATGDPCLDGRLIALG